MAGDPRYADAGGTQIAYWDLGGAGSLDIVVVAGAFFPVEALLDDSVSARFIEGLQTMGRVVVFDKRGVGLSDPLTDWDRSPREQWADDLAAVCELIAPRPVVVSWDTFGVARTAIAAAPDLASRLVLMNPVPNGERFVAQFVAVAGEPGEATAEGLERVAFPSRVDEPGFQRWLERAGRSGASPSMAIRLWEATLGDAAAFTPPGIACPTLVLHRRHSMAPASGIVEVADAIADSTIVTVEGADAYPIAGDPDPLLVEIARFLDVSQPLLRPERAVRAVLFTDIVGSTLAAAKTGDAAWKRTLDEHDSVVRGAVERSGGEIVKFTGDGVLALLPSASAAVAAAHSMCRTLAPSGVELRTGIHVGDVERRGDDVSGLSVHVAARVMAEAGAGEILVTESVRASTVGSDIEYLPARSVELRGVPGRWDVFRVSDD